MEKIRASLLLSPNDWDEIKNSLRNRVEKTMKREMGEFHLEASTVMVDSEAWETDMLVGIVVRYRGRTDRQYFDSAEEARRRTRGWMYGTGYDERRLPGAAAKA